MHVFAITLYISCVGGALRPHASGFALGVRKAHAAFDLAFISPVRRIDQLQGSGGLGEHCSSSAVGHVLCAPPGRVAQPRLLVTDRWNPAGAANRGRLFFGYFPLAKQKKVTSCRATPDGFDLRNGKQQLDARLISDGVSEYCNNAVCPPTN